MVRWAANPRERLAEAALELFAERGYDRTTVADIAERAGLTRSTFFRHFADKREVLAAGQDGLLASIRGAVAAAPVEAPALDVLSAVLDAVALHFPDEHRCRVAARAATVDAQPELRERELLKREALATALGQALVDRGSDALSARLAAAVAVLALDVALERWMSGDGAFRDAAADALRSLVASVDALRPERV